MRLSAAAARLPAIVAACGIVPLLALTLVRAVDIPFGDEWEWADLIYGAHQHSLTFAQLWAPHNEHRIFIPALIALALDAVAGWSVVREQLISLAFLGLTQLALWGLIRRTVPVGRRGVCFLVASALLLGLVQYENLYWGFQIAWFLVDLCAVVALLQLTRPHGGPQELSFAIALATIAGLSSAQGLLVWPAGLVAIALIPRDRLPRLAAWLLAGIAVTAAVRWGGPATGAGYVALSHLDVIARYVLVYLGSPLALSFGLQTAALRGALAIAWTAAIVVFALRAPLAARVRLAPWLALAAYALLCALATAAARAGFGVEQALAPRYTTIAELIWVAAFAATCIVIPRGTALRFGLVAGVAAMLLAATVHQSYAGDLAWRLHAIALRDAGRLLDVGDPRAFVVLYPYPDRVQVLLGELARIHDGVFSRAR